MLIKHDDLQFIILIINLYKNGSYYMIIQREKLKYTHVYLLFLM